MHFIIENDAAYFCTFKCQMLTHSPHTHYTTTTSVVESGRVSGQDRVSRVYYAGCMH